MAASQPSRIENPNPETILRAAALLRAGRLVAFPTETVYGLGADARNADAVRRIFTAKGRPSTNPVIVHGADVEQLQQIVSDWPETATKLAERFWPGPLTLVLPKHVRLPVEVTANGPTVGVRIPNHPVALQLLRAVQMPIAAPSANRANELSPTTAQHVAHSLEDRVDLILDGGPCPGGIESTVLDLTSAIPRILRPGLITAEDLFPIIGPVHVGTPIGGTPLPSPGLMPRHYAPKTPVELVPTDGSDRVQALCDQGLRIGWLTWADVNNVERAHRITMPNEPRAYSAQLYAVLHELDAMNLDRIVISFPPDEPAWLAVRDRLSRAAR